MFPAEPHEQDVLFTANPLLQDAMGTMPEAMTPGPSAAEAFGFRRQREAAMLHRNGRLRAIQALHRLNKPKG